MQASQLIADLFKAVTVLAELASEAVGSAGADGMPDSLAAQLQAAARTLRERERQLMAAVGPDATLAEHASVLQQLQQPAADLAALLRQQAALPAVEAQRRLVVARAAAVRSCAFLGCANVGGRGGPAAGQGEGSLLCR